jgi:cell division protein FtsA
MMNFGFIKEIKVKDNSLIVALDIGTTKVCAVVGEVNAVSAPEERGRPDRINQLNELPGRSVLNGPGQHGITIIGVGSAPSRGIKKGDVISMEGLVDSIRHAVQEAGIMAGVEIRAVHLGITGRHIGCIPSHGVIALKEDEIGQKDIDSAIEAAKAVAIPFDREMLHVIPVGFSVNGQSGITDPRGMCGVRLETDVRIITAASTSVQNLVRSCEKAGLEVIDVIFQPLASAMAVLTEDEKNLGVAVIDIGGGTTDIALFQDGNIFHSAVMAIGGNNFTNDLAIGLRISTREAEEIKMRYGSSHLAMIKEDEHLEIGHTDDRAVKKIPRSYLVEILQPRAEELFSLVREEIVRNGYYKNLNSGVVLTGGSVLMEGMDVMAENILELPVRIGRPGSVSGITDDLCNPSCAAAFGVVQYAAGECTGEEEYDSSSLLTGFTTRMKGWVGEIFKI